MEDSKSVTWTILTKVFPQQLHDGRRGFVLILLLRSDAAIAAVRAEICNRITNSLEILREAAILTGIHRLSYRFCLYL